MIKLGTTYRITGNIDQHIMNKNINFYFMMAKKSGFLVFFLE